MKGKSRAVLTAGLGIVLSLSITSSAEAAVTGLDIGSGSLEDKGLAATVPVTFTCDAGGLYWIEFSLRQIARQRTITEGYAGTSGSCTGEPQTLVLQFQPSPEPFKSRKALADVSMSSYCYVGVDLYEHCGDARVTEEIQLRR